MLERLDLRVVFITLWLALLLAKIALAAHVPLFVDEAFYWQESRHLSWAYSDLPGLTAWLIRLGSTLFGDGVLGVRLPFLLIAATLPWLVARIVMQISEVDTACHPWQAAIATLLLPLAGTLGLLALPDVTLAFATLLCVAAAVRLVRGVSDGAALELALGLAIGALSHYRFIAVIAVGFIVLLLSAPGRAALRDPRVWIAVAFGAAAWTPLMAWNFENAEAGLRFQLIDRHPWTWQPGGAWFLLVQAVMVTPLLFVALLWAGWRESRKALEPRRALALLGGLVVLGFYVLGFFADTERVSFHWPLPGYLALLPLLPAVLAQWPKALRIATWAVASFGLLAALGFYAFVSDPGARAHSAAWKWYPANFAGWEPLTDAVVQQRAAMPPTTRIVADNFKVGAELGFALGDPTIAVLDHPLNQAHGRAPQLRLWGLETRGRADWGVDPVLLVIGASDVEYKNLLQRYHTLCMRVGPLPPPQVVNVDHGRTRYLLFALHPGPPVGVATGQGTRCVAPAMAWIDAPVSGARVSGRLDISGWAFKEGVGIERVEVLLDGAVSAEAVYGLSDTGVAAFWKTSQDPQHPDVGFRARIPTAGISPGRHWLGLRLHGRDGSVEDWSEQPITIE